MNWFSAFLLILIFVLVLGGLLLLVKSIGGEDSWIKDSKGVWIKHGNPVIPPDYVTAQQVVIQCAKNLLNVKSKIENISSQCLGTCSNYSVDVVHVPRSQEDDLVDNQCQDYLNRLTTNFIELDSSGNIVRIK